MFCIKLYFKKKQQLRLEQDNVCTVSHTFRSPIAVRAKEMYVVVINMKLQQH